MQKIFNLTSTFKSVEEADDGSVNIKGYASTNDTDRAGDVIDKEAWEKGGLDNFGNNPFILFNHDYNRPIGRATGLETDDRGLKLTANISKSAGDVTNLVKEGILRAFSVGFRVRNADYIEETDGLKISDAELFEISVVSVPANQAATFSVAKSFDTQSEYDEWKKQFVKITETEESQDADESLPSRKENEMSENTENFDLEEFAKKVASETAAKIAMQQAEQKAADTADAEKAAEEQAAQEAELEQKKAEVKAIVEAGTTRAEQIVSDLEKRVYEQYDNVEEVVDSLKAALKEKSEEMIITRQKEKIAINDNGKKDSIEIVNRSIGMMKIIDNVSYITYHITYKALVISPSIGDKISCIVSSNNKMGLIGYVKDNEIDTIEDSPFVIIIPREYFSDVSDIDDININDKINVVIDNYRTKYLGKQIQIVAKPV